MERLYRRASESESSPSRQRGRQSGEGDSAGALHQPRRLRAQRSSRRRTTCNHATLTTTLVTTTAKLRSDSTRVGQVRTRSASLRLRLPLRAPLRLPASDTVTRNYARLERRHTPTSRPGAPIIDPYFRVTPRLLLPAEPDDSTIATPNPTSFSAHSYLVRRMNAVTIAVPSRTDCNATNSRSPHHSLCLSVSVSIYLSVCSLGGYLRSAHWPNITRRRLTRTHLASKAPLCEDAIPRMAPSVSGQTSGRHLLLAIDG